MRCGVLGSLEVRGAEGGCADLGGRRQRRLLAALVINAGSTVSDERLTEMVWTENEPPEGGVRALRTVFTRLRSALHDVGGDQLILTKPPGHVLSRDGLETDAHEFDLHVAAAQRLHAEGDHAGALSSVDAGLALWRGAAYAEFLDDEWARPEATRLEESRILAHEIRIDANIASGAHRESISELETLVAVHPYRERFRIQLITALYRSGRQTEALRQCQSYRDVLADELGLDPSATLRDLETQILNHDPRLAVKPSSQPRIKSYELEEKIGAGAWGVVWRARQPTIDRDVAIKVIDPDVANQPEFVRRFEVEARIVAGLEHPHVLPVYDYWRDPSGAYLVTRLMRGGSAADRLASHGAWAVPAVVSLVEQISGALTIAHRAGVVHRDVKPSNILLDGDGNVVLSDFGIAIHGNPDRAAHATGSIGYAAPEQLAGIQVGPSSDVFGLAVTVWELLAGKHPTDVSALPALHAVRADVPVQVDVPLRKATALDPADRYADVAEFVEAFTVAAGATPRTYVPGSVVAKPKLESAFRRPLVNPYKGLRPFAVGDELDFFGRDELVQQVLETLAAGPFCAAVGPSGAGKSSLINAGVLPALRRGELPGADRWFVASMVPGSAPFEELERALLHVAVNPLPSLAEHLAAGVDRFATSIQRAVDTDAHVLLVVDQFEELYTQCALEVADRFVDGLVAAIAGQESSSWLHTIITLRADFFDRPLSDQRLAPLINASTIPIGAMMPDALELAITGPAARVGVVVDRALLDDVMTDAEGQPAALPLVQYMLTELFERRTGAILTREAYRALGGLGGVVANRAEELFDELAPDGRAATRHLFGRLVSVGDGVADTRRRARRSELESHHDASAMTQAIERFGAGRLLVFDHDGTTREPTVEIAHEALLTTWPRLRGWLDEDRDVLRSVSHISAASSAWEASGRDPGDLLRGARLADALAIEERAPDRLTGAEREYVTASRDAFEADQLRQRRQRRRLRTLLSVAAVLLVIASVAGVIARRQSNRAEANADEALTRRLVAESARLASTKPDTAILLALEARSRERSIDTLGAIERVWAHKPHAWLGFMWIDSVVDDAFLPNGQLAIAGKNEVAVWDLSTRTKLWSAPEQYAVIAASPRGDVVIAARAESYASFDAVSGSKLNERPLGAAAPVTVAAISPDGSTLAVGTSDGELLLVDLATNAVDTADGVLLGAEDNPTPVESIAFDPTGPRVAYIGGFRSGALLWDLAERQQIGGVLYPTPDGTRDGSGTAGGVTFSNGALWVASGFVRPFDPATASPLGTEISMGDLLGDSLEKLVIAVSGEQAWVAGSQAVLVIDLAQGLVTQLPINGRLMLSIAMHPERHIVARATFEGLDLWALDSVGLGVAAVVPSARRGDARIDSSFAHISSDGTTVVSSQLDVGEIRALDEGGRLSGRVDQLDPTRDFAVDWGLRLVGDTVIQVGVQPNDATASMLRVWDPNSETFGEEFQSVPDRAIKDRFVMSAAANEATIALGRNGGIVDVYDRRTRRLVATLIDPAFGSDEERSISEVRFTPSGDRMIVADGVDGVSVYDTETWQRVEEIPRTERTREEQGDGFQNIVFTSDGQFAVTHSIFQGLEVRDPVTLEVLRSVPSEATSHFFRVLDISSDGSIIEVTGAEGARLIDFETLQQIGDPFPHETWGNAATYAHDVDLLATNVGQQVVVWKIDPDMWETEACTLAGRNLSRSEWEQYGFTEPYHLTCPMWGEYPSAPAPSGA